VAAAHAITQRDGEDNIDYIVLPEDAFALSAPRPSPDDSLPKYLSDRHYEVPGLHEPERLSAVCAAAVEATNQGRVVVARLRPKETKAEFVAGLRDEPGIVEHTRWTTLSPKGGG
jgi:hypothetical protein